MRRSCRVAPRARTARDDGVARDQNLCRSCPLFVQSSDGLREASRTRCSTMLASVSEATSASLLCAVYLGAMRGDATLACAPDIDKQATTHHKVTICHDLFMTTCREWRDAKDYLVVSRFNVSTANASTDRQMAVMRKKQNINTHAI